MAKMLLGCPPCGRVESALSRMQHNMNNIYMRNQYCRDYTRINQQHLGLGLLSPYHRHTPRPAAAVLEDAERIPDKEENWFPDLNLDLVPEDNSRYDVVIAGAGPSGLAVASRVAAAGFNVAVVDPEPLGQWINNYGVWVDEFVAMGLDDCFDVVWPSATVYLNSSGQGEKTLSRPYARVDRPKLKRKLLEQCIERGVKFHQAKVKDSSNLGDGTCLTCEDGFDITGTFAVDATGHSRKLVHYDGKYDPGYQGAYGITVNVESHPFDVDKMLFMDWRDDHLDGYPDLKKSNARYVCGLKH